MGIIIIFILNTFQYIYKLPNFAIFRDEKEIIQPLNYLKRNFSTFFYF